MTNTVKKQGSLQPLRKSVVSRMRETPNQYPPVNVIPWGPYYPQYPPVDAQYLLQDPQYIMQDPQYILQDPQYIRQDSNIVKQPELNTANVEVPPYPHFSPYPPQDVYPQVVYTYATEPPHMAWGEARMPIYGDWSQIPSNIQPVTKIEPVEIVEIDEPVVVLGPAKNINVVTKNDSRGNAMLKSRVKQGESVGPAKMDILKLAMNKTKIVEQNNVFVDEVLNPVDSVESSDENSLEQLENNLASVENSLKYLESNLAYKVNDSLGSKKSPQTIVDIVDSINNRLEYNKEMKGGPLENKMNAVINNLFNDESTKDVSKVMSTEIPLDDSEYSQWVFDDSDLPTGWITRSYNIIVNGKSSVEHQFLSPDQTLFSSLSSLIEYMKTEGNFSREIMENVIVSKSGTVEIEQSLMNSLNSESFEQDNKHDSGSRFNNPTDNLIYDETLPPGWKKRSVEVKSNQHKSGKVTRYYYYSKTNEMFTSRSAVVQHMRQSGNYSDEQIVKVLSGGGHTGKRPASVEKIVKVSPGSGKRPSDTGTGVENISKKIKLEKKLVEENFFSDWMSDSSLPTGWKIRSRKVENDLTVQTDYQYLSPDIKLFKSRSDVNEYLKTFNVDNVLTNTIENDQQRQSIIKHTNTGESLASNGEYDDEVNDLEKLLMEAANTSKRPLAKNNVNPPKMLARSDKSGSEPEQDWEFDESLPNGWKKRAFKRKFKSMGVDKFVTQYQYMSPEGQKFTSRAQVVAHMEQSEKYSKEEITAVEKGKNCRGKTLVLKTIDETQIDIAKDIKVENHANVTKDVKVKTPDKFVEVKTEGKIDKLMISKRKKERTPIVKVEAPVKIAKDKMKHVATKISKLVDKTKTKGTQFMSTDWETDNDMLPEGWAKRAYENNNKVKVFQYCNNIHNPRNIFQSKIEVVRFMKNSKRYSLDEAFKFLIGVEKQNDATFSVKEENLFEFECNYCPLQFLTSNDQMSHQQQEHAGQFRFKCNECGTGDLKKISLMYHVQSKHEGEQKGEKVTFDFEIPDKKEVLVQTKISLPQPRPIQVNNIIKPNAKNDVVTPSNLSLQSIKSISSEITKKHIAEVFTKKETIGDNIPLKIKEENHKNTQNAEENLNKIKTITEDQINVEKVAPNENANAVKTNAIPEEQFGVENIKPKIENLIDSEDTSEEKKDAALVLNTEREALEFLENLSESTDDLSDPDDFDSQIANIEKNIEALTNNGKNMQNISIPIGPKITIRMDNFEILSLLFLATPNPIDTMIQDLSVGNNMSVEDVEWTFIKLRNKFQHEDGEEVNREAVQEMVNQLKAEYQSDDYFEI